MSSGVNTYDTITESSDRYPTHLRELPHAPVLHVRGSIEKEDALAVAIVGSRRATPYGLEVAETLARDLAARGVTIVSGLARGIDTAAHRGALDGGGRTIAVLGSGLDRLYPPENRALAATIAEHGAVVENDMGIKDDIVPEPAVAADHHAAVKPAARPQDAPLADGGKGKNRGLGPDLGCGVHGGTRINTHARRIRRRFGLPMHVTHDGHKGAERIGDLNQGHAVSRHRCGHDRGRSATAAQQVRMTVIRHKGDRGGLGVAQRPGGRDDQIGVPDNLSVDELRQLPDGGAHARTSFLP